MDIMTRIKPMNLPSIGASTIGVKENYSPKTWKLIELLCSEQFRNGGITKYQITRRKRPNKTIANPTGYAKATVDYWFTKIYFKEKFDRKYLRK